MDEIKYIEPQQESRLFSDVCQIIDGARSRIATYVNTEACLTNWYVGKRIKEDVLYNKRAEYGKQVILNLSAKLTARYGSGWSEKTLRHCLRSAETFSEDDIVSAKPLLSPESTITNSPKEPRSTKRAPLLPPKRNNYLYTQNLIIPSYDRNRTTERVLPATERKVDLYAYCPRIIYPSRPASLDNK